MQRDDWPSEPLRRMGSAANAGFVFVRATHADNAARLLMDIVVRGLIEFYLRWNNIVDQYGISYALIRPALHWLVISRLYVRA